MIVVLGRPRATRALFGSSASLAPCGLAVDVARAAVEAGSSVELVGVVGDDPAGDAVVVGLANAQVGHAALLRDPAAGTSIDGVRGARPPELGAGDVALGLSYLLDYRVLVLAEPLTPEATAAAIAAAGYQSAQLVVIVAPGEAPDPALAALATVLEAPAREGAAFARMVGRFAAALDAGAPAGPALTSAVRATGWTAVQ